MLLIIPWRRRPAPRRRRSRPRGTVDDALTWSQRGVGRRSGGRHHRGPRLRGFGGYPSRPVPSSSSPPGDSDPSASGGFLAVRRAKRFRLWRQFDLVSRAEYLALHFGALFDDVAGTVVSGIFLPYACINTDYHPGCQHFAGMAGHADTSDVAGLIAPRRLLVQFGGRDRFYSPAVGGLVARTQDAFAGQGAAGAFRFDLDERGGHALRPQAVSDFLSPGAGATRAEPR